MLFCSQSFLLFFSVVFVLYWATPWQRARVWLLLVASFYFYASWNEWLAMLICISTLWDYLLARGMAASTSNSRRKLLLMLSLVANLGLLCYFKYANFFLHSVAEALQAIGASASLPVLRVILPVGISFYTFEAISYTVDVYWRRIPVERNLANFMLFITFFPHLVAGPIVRARDFLPQIQRPKRWDWARLELGVRYFLMGLFKKLAIADHMALFADPVFADPARYSSHALWTALVAYSLQVYCDFSGYSDMAIGAAHMLGYKLPLNFNMPYLSANISELWRRWHISLSSWLRDYLFIPLGGSRGPEWKSYRNLMVTMVAGGLWHGANWTFVLFGVYHGWLLIVLKAFQSFCRARSFMMKAMQSAPVMALCVAVTLFSFVIGLVPVRCQSLSLVWTMYRGMALPQHGLAAPLHDGSLWCTVALVVICHIAGRYRLWEKTQARLPAAVLGFGYAVLLACTLALAPASGKTFVYFQF